MCLAKDRRTRSQNGEPLDPFSTKRTKQTKLGGRLRIRSKLRTPDRPSHPSYSSRDHSVCCSWHVVTQTSFLQQGRARDCALRRSAFAEAEALPLRSGKASRADLLSNLRSQISHSNSSTPAVSGVTALPRATIPLSGGVSWLGWPAAFGKIGVQFTAAQFVRHGKRQGTDPIPDTLRSTPNAA